MKIISAVALFAGLGSAGAGCYTGGDTLGGTDPYYHSKRACEGYSGIAGAFQGWFAPNQEKYACVNTNGNTLKLEMWVKNLNGAVGFDLGDTDCTKEFENIMAACVWGHGGDSDSAGWYFRIDPNPGAC